MHHIRFFKWLTAAALGTALAVVPAMAFTDTEGHWAEESIQKWSEEYRIIQGYEDGTFRPDASITRGAFAGIMDRFLQFQAISEPETFSDTAGNYWESAILKLHAAGVYLGTNGKALAGNTITRQQAVTMIARAFHIDADTTSLFYADEAQIAEYARPAVAEMTARGYVNDTWDGNFRPTDPITRAEIINILSNMIDTLVQTSDPVTGDVAGTLMINSASGATLTGMTVHGDLIVAPGVTGDIGISNVAVLGHIRNFGTASFVEVRGPENIPTEPEEPDIPAILPGDVYLPGETTGNTILYSGKEIPIYEGREPLRLYDGDFYWNNGRLTYIGGDFDTRFGIDVSAYQNRASGESKTIDWDAVRDDGVEFVMVRVGLRGTSTGELHADEYYAQNIDGAMAAGLETGVYFFAQAITVEEAIEEADFVIELLKDHEIDGPVAYDWEMHDSSYRVYGTPPEMATACAIAFCERIKEAGYTPMIYAGQYVSYIKYDQGAIAPYLSWYPEYKSESSEKLYPTFYYQMDYWQFSSNCYVNGIGGRVDGNLQFIPR
ncbi:S-layer homology domain-containing protein [Oscillibacter sp.]|uniref:S-layer homology domain-containing protein n=1 Tax=Oscillibacter sp. TaxID=1945593 RepID=UPI001B3FB2E4|nr:S-layer homology domain-containing protein [Oscillibacter sp.]MBP3510293.1 S-layer homology domain-containing protein [Oscillibacter sp.]